VLAVVVALAAVAMSCKFPVAHESSCSTDADQCPESSRSATNVTCDCHCTIGISEDTGQSFDGTLTVCLPAPLNPVTGSESERSVLGALASRAFNQEIFNYCGHDVARFARMAIKANAGSLIGACAMPVSCECTTAGAQVDSSLCHSTCRDVGCAAENCSAVLRTGAKLDLSSCYCTRATACDESEPEDGTPSICRDWTAPDSAGESSAPTPRAF
jgi:hypothetical protein